MKILSKGSLLNAKSISKRARLSLIVKQHRGELHPQIVIYADKEYKELIGTYPIPSGAIISVEEGQYATAGKLLSSLAAGQR